MHPSLAPMQLNVMMIRCCKYVMVQSVGAAVVDAVERFVVVVAAEATM